MTAPGRENGPAVRVVQVLGALAAGGAERLVSELLPELAGLGFAPELLLLSPRRDAAGDEMAAGLDRAGVPFRSGPTQRVGPASVLWLGRQLRRARPSLVHLHNLNAEMAYLLARPWTRFPHEVVRTVHNTRLDPPWLARLGFRWNGAAATIFCGAAAGDHTASGFGGRSVVIPNGVRFDWAPQSPDVSRTARGRLSWPEGRPGFVSVGRMDGESMAASQKAHDVLVRAWQQSGLGREGALLHLVGDGPLRGSLEALAGGDTSIRFHGVRPDVRTWLQAADAFVMASRFEGLPIAGIEAIGTGLRCVFSRIDPLRELGAPSVVWCDPDDEASLAVALREVLAAAEPAAEQVAALRARFGIESLASRHAELYREVLAGRGPVPS